MTTVKTVKSKIPGVKTKIQAGAAKVKTGTVQAKPAPVAKAKAPVSKEKKEPVSRKGPIEVGFKAGDIVKLSNEKVQGEFEVKVIGRHNSRLLLDPKTQKSGKFPNSEMVLVKEKEKPAPKEKAPKAPKAEKASKKEAVAYEAENAEA